MRVYIAGRFARKLELQVYGARLRKAGHTVTSRWLMEHNSSEEPEDLRIFAREDLHDVQAAQMVLLFTDGADREGCHTGGRHFECGYAHALGKPLWLVGPKENIFHFLEPVVAFERFEWALEHLGSMDAQQREGGHYECDRR